MRPGNQTRLAAIGRQAGLVGPALLLGTYFSSLTPNQSPPPKPNVIELQIDASDSQLPFYEEVSDQDFGVSLDHSTF